MSVLSKLSGVHISKHGVHIEPLKALATAATIGSFGGLGPIAGIASKVGSVATKIPGVAKLAGGASTIYNTLKGKGGTTNIGGVDVPTGGYDYSNIADKVSGDSGSLLDKATGLVKTVRKATGGKPITLKNTLGRVGGAVKGALGSALDNPIETIGGLAAAKSGADAFKRAGDYSNKAVKTAEQSYSERAPLRQLGVAGMQKPTAAPVQDYVNTANPFAKKRKVTLPPSGRLV